MSQLQELEKLYAKKRTFKIPKEPKEGEVQAILEVKPLALDEMSCFDMKKDMPLNEMAEKMIEMLSYTLGVKKEEAGKIQFVHMTELLDVIVELNDLPEEQVSKINKVKGFMAEKQRMKELEKEDESEPSKSTKE